MQDLTKDPLYAEHYAKLPVEHIQDEDMAQDRALFETWLETISMRLVMMPKEFAYSSDILISEGASHFVDIIIRAMDDDLDDNKRDSQAKYQKLFQRLSYHRDIIDKCLTKKKSWARHMSLLKLMAVLSVVVQNAKNQKARIPALFNLFCHLQGEMMKTEREVPPMVIPQHAGSRTFLSEKRAAQGGIISHVHGAIGFQADTGDVKKLEDFPPDLAEKIKEEARKYTELYTNESKRPSQQKYPVPTIKYNGKTYQILHIRLEEYFAPPNCKPPWLARLVDEILRRTKDKENQKKLNVSDVVIHDVFKRVFGYKTAIKCKVRFLLRYSRV